MNRTATHLRSAPLASWLLVALAPLAACSATPGSTHDDGVDAGIDTGRAEDDASSDAGDANDANGDAGDPDADAAAAEPDAGDASKSCLTGFHLCEGACRSDGDLPTLAGDECVVDEAFGVFVSASAGDDANPGTRAAPLKSIHAAIAAAAPSKKRVYACAEAYAETEVDALASGVSVFGYFTCAGGEWAVGHDRAVVTAPPSADRAVTATNVTDVRLEAITWIAPSAPAGTAGSSYGLVARDSLLELVDVDLVAGKGGDGASATATALSNVAPPCGAAGDGLAGSAGSAGSPAAGAWSASGYSPGRGGDGASGAAGHGGALVAPGTCTPQSCAIAPMKSCTVVDEAPVAGTAGTPGCGGPGGAGGLGGAGGGSSVALFAWGGSIAMTRGHLTSSDGGNGGAGASGASAPTTWAQRDGAAGPGADCLRVAECFYEPPRCHRSLTAHAAGGTGGAGGPGGAGGTGAGGAGGDSFAVYRGGGAIVALDAEVVATPGAAGRSAGPVPGAAGRSGVLNATK